MNLCCPQSKIRTSLPLSVFDHIHRIGHDVNQIFVTSYVCRPSCARLECTYSDVATMEVDALADVIAIHLFDHA